MELNDLLLKAGIDPQTVLVFRHRPSEPLLCKEFRWLAHDRPELFNAYQQTHGAKVEKALQRAKYVAAFIGHEAGKAIFVGLYEVGFAKPLSFAEYWAVPAYMELKERFKLQGFVEDAGRESVLWFDLKLCDFRSSWKGKLVVHWPGPELSWYRWADRNQIFVSAIHEESLLVAPKPGWHEVVLDWQSLATLPYSWRTSLEE